MTFRDVSKMYARREILNYQGLFFKLIRKTNDVTLVYNSLYKSQRLNYLYVY